MNAARVLIFDMDGVLVDVSESYRETIARTVEHFSGKKVTRGLIQDYKNSGDWNNDWALSQRIAADLGAEVEYQTVVEYFQKIFLGDGNNGLILREQWIAQPGLLDRLQERFALTIFTGRPRAEAKITLDRFAANICFELLIGEEDVTRGKPHPEGLLKIKELYPGSCCWYIGDTVADARCAKAAEVPFVGIAAPSNPRHTELVPLLRAHGAAAVLDDINQLEGVLPA